MTEDKHTEAPASINVKLTGKSGADIWLTLRTGVCLDTAKELIDVLAKTMKYAEETYGLVPQKVKSHSKPATPSANGAGASNGSAPVCKYHGEMKRSKHFPGWYCPSKMGDGGYCKEQVKD